MENSQSAWIRYFSILMGAIALFVGAFSHRLEAQPNPSPSLTRMNQFGCFRGRAEGQFDGDLSLTRREFAAGLSACLQQIERRLTQPTYSSRSEYEAVWQKQQQLQQQLRELNDQLDSVQ